MVKTETQEQAQGKKCHHQPQTSLETHAKLSKDQDLLEVTHSGIISHLVGTKHFHRGLDLARLGEMKQVSARLWPGRIMTFVLPGLSWQEIIMTFPRQDFHGKES